MFSYMLDTARVNSSTIYAMNQGVDPIKQISFEYTFQLVMELMKPTMEGRNQNGMLMTTKQKISLVLGRAPPIPEPRAENGPAFGCNKKEVRFMSTCSRRRKTIRKIKNQLVV